MLYEAAVINMVSVMDKQESRKHAHNARIRKKLLGKAAPLFRDRGPDNVGIDEVMQRAGMTRGAFYAHFKSKEDIFLAALHQETPLLLALERRVSQDPAGLLSEMRGVFESYLANNATPTARTCTLAGLAVDVSRGTDEARATHEAVQHAVRVEMARGMSVHHDDAIVHATLALAVGSVVMASAQRTGPGRAKVLEAGRAGVNDLLDGFWAEPAAAPVAETLPEPVRVTPPLAAPVERPAALPPLERPPVRPPLAKATLPPRALPQDAPSAAALAQIARARSLADRATEKGDLPPRPGVAPVDPRGKPGLGVKSEPEAPKGLLGRFLAGFRSRDS